MITIIKLWSKKLVMSLLLPNDGPRSLWWAYLNYLLTCYWNPWKILHGFFVVSKNQHISETLYAHTFIFDYLCISNDLFLKITRFLSSTIFLFLIVYLNFVYFTFLHMLVLSQSFHLKLPFKGFTPCMHKNTKFKLKIKIHSKSMHL